MLALPLVALACESEKGEPLESEAGIRPRVFNPPPSRVRAVPPHHVHAVGIGPYEIGASLKEILGTLPHGPRIELFRLGRLADFSLAKPEDGGLLVGIEREVGVTFVAAVADKIARTEGGSGIGSPVAEIARELGPPLLTSEVATDPRVRRHRDLPGVAFISGLSSSKAPQIAAIVVDGPGESAPAKGPAKATPGEEPSTAPSLEKSCVVGSALEERVRVAARIGGPVEVAFLCSGNVVTGAVAHASRRLTWLTIDRGKVKRAGSTNTGNLTFAAPIAFPDGLVHIVAVSEERTVSELQVLLEVYRVEGARLAPAASKRLYSLSKAEVSWVGGSLAGVEVATEVVFSAPSELRVSGFYIEQRGDRVAMVAPLAAQEVSLKRRPTAIRKEGARDAGVGPDAGAKNASADAAAKPKRVPPTKKPTKPTRAPAPR